MPWPPGELKRSNSGPRRPWTPSRCGSHSRAGPHRADLHYAGDPYGGPRGGHRCHGLPANSSAQIRGPGGHGPPADAVAILGQGPIGLIFTMLATRTGARVVATDAMASRRTQALKFGAQAAMDPQPMR